MDFNKPNGRSDLHFLGDGCRLTLGLGSSLSSCNADCFHSSLGKTKEAGSKRLELGLSCGAISQASIETSPFPVIDEESTSAKRSSGGYIPHLLFAPRLEVSKDKGSRPETDNMFDEDHYHGFGFCFDASTIINSSAGITSDYSGFNFDSRHNHNTKKCEFVGRSEEAKGVAGPFIADGGRQSCGKPGCSRYAKSGVVFCKFHGRGRRCQKIHCTKNAGIQTEFFIAHVGGRQCGHPACANVARGKSGLCIKHGGGKRCVVDDCGRSAEGQAGLCISHGGGRRCQHLACTKGAQGSTMYCKAHGGGKRCIFDGCTKGAEGSTPLCKGHGGGKRCLFKGGGVCPKSVHGGTGYCVAHGGGKRCAVPGCSKSARGRTDCCVRHGGGKRCRSEGCEKSAQGNTDFCKAHGGGKRCAWHQACQKFARGKNGLCASHGSMAALHVREGGGLIRAGLFDGIVPISLNIGGRNEKDSSTLESASCTLYNDKTALPMRGGGHLIRAGLFNGIVPMPSTAASGNDGENSASKCGIGAGLQMRGESLIRPGLFEGIVPMSSTIRGSNGDDNSISERSTVLDSMEMPVPRSTKAVSLCADGGGGQNGQSRQSSHIVIPEGRVHGGELMFLLGGTFKDAAERLGI